MAVNIPVVIDIDKAFDEASKRVNTAIRPLQRSIEDGTANIKLKIGERYDAQLDQVVGKYETLGHLINDVQKNQKTGASSMKYSIEEWAAALDNAKQRLSDLKALQANGQAVPPNTLNALRESVSVLTSVIEQRRREAELIETTTQKQIAATRAIEAGDYALIQEANTISQISDKLSALRGKLENLDPSKNRKEWTATAREIEKTTAQLQKYKQMLSDTTKPGSIDRMRAEMQKLEQQWNSMSKRQKFDADGNLTASAQRVVKQFQALTAESEKYGQSLSKVAGTAKPAIDRMTNSLRTQSSVLRSLSAYASMYVSVFGAIRFFKQIRDVTGELEYQRVALGHLIQDEEYGAKLFERIKAAALESPFRIKDLVTYTKQLAAYRIEQENLFDTTQRLADISAGLGVDMNRLILAYGQVRAASVLRGQELRQFTEAGIPLVDLLAEKFTELKGEMVSTADVFKLISERAVPFSMIAEIFEDLTDKGGMFYEMQETQAKTLQGRWEKLKDAFDVGLQSIGESEGLIDFNFYSNALLKTFTVLAKNLRIIPKILEGATTSWVLYKLAILATGKAHKTELAYTTLYAASAKASAASAEAGVFVHKRLTAAYIAEASATNFLTKSLAKLRIALWTNPWIAAATAALGLLTAFLSFKEKSDDIVSSFESIENAIEKMSDANSADKKTETLIKRYETLSKKTERTAAENLKLADTMNTLKEQFPELIEEIGSENVALEDQISDLEEYRKRRIEKAREEAKQELQIEEGRNRSLTEKYNERLVAYNKAYANFLQRRADEELGAAEINKAFQGTQTHFYTDKELKKLTDDANALAVQAKADLDEIGEALKKSNSEIMRLNNLINPQSAQKDWDEWKKQVKRIQEEKEKLGDSPVFTPEELGGINTVYDLFGKLKKRIKDLEESLNGMREALSKMSAGDAYDQMSKDISSVEKTLSVANAIKDFFGFDFSTKNGNGYQKSAFIVEMENRIKFMKDFKKGYDDLTKYLRKSSALSEEAGIMLGRGASLGLSASEQSRAAEDLSNWYGDMITEVSNKLRQKGVSGVTATDLLGIDTTKRSKEVQDLQKLLQSLWDAKTDFDVSQKKKDMEDAIKRLTEEIKRSETARNFFNNILELTGDEELATTMGISVYGNIGDEFKDRMQEQLNGALASLKADRPVSQELENAFRTMDFEKILSIEDLPDKVKSVVRDAYESVQKYNSDVVKSYAKLLMKFDDVRQKSVDVEAKANKDIADLRAGLALTIKGINENAAIQDKEAAIAAATARADAVEEGIKREKELNQLRLTRNYRLFFESLGTMSLESARKIAKAERDLVTAQFEAGEISLSKFTKELDKIDERLEKYENDRNPLVTYLSKGLDGLVEKIKQTGYDMYALSGNILDDNGELSFSDESIKAINRLGMFFGGDLFGVSGRKNTFEKMMEQNGQNIEKWKKSLDEAGEKLIAMGSDFARGMGWADFWVSFAGNGIKAFDQIAEKSKNSQGEVKEGWNKAAKFIMTSAAGMLTGTPITAGILGQKWDLDDAWERFTGLNDYAMSGFEKFKKGDLIGALIDNINGWAEVFGKNTKKIERQIKKQAELIKDLEYEYSRLEVAIDEAFGSDYVYNYNKEVSVLQAQADAYRKQAELERSKGKKADEDTAKAYEESARKIEDQIKDMEGQLAEFFSGTDLTSAAQDFATAWIDAYKEFGSTTDAMREKFDEMVENMVVNSLAGKLMQDILRPIFDQIDTAAKDGELTAQEIGAISALVPDRVKMINDAMAGMVNQLTASGINIRDTVGQFSGISRNIAGASEESINGLAAGINTQNFYMQHIDMTVSAILSVLSGGTAGGTDANGAEVVDPYKNQMLLYVSSLPQMRDDMASVRAMLEKVIRPVGTTTTHYVAVKL